MRRTEEVWIRRELSHLSEEQAVDLSRVVDTLVQRFHPERIYLFGSQARGAATWNSDVDLLVVVPDAGVYPHHLAQQAYHAIGHHLLPLELVFMSREDFNSRAEVVTSLPATVLREGRLLYAAAAT